MRLYLREVEEVRESEIKKGKEEKKGKGDEIVGVEDSWVQLRVSLE